MSGRQCTKVPVGGVRCLHWIRGRQTAVAGLTRPQQGWAVCPLQRYTWFFAVHVGICTLESSSGGNLRCPMPWWFQSLCTGKSGVWHMKLLYVGWTSMQFPGDHFLNHSWVQLLASRCPKSGAFANLPTLANPLVNGPKRFAVAYGVFIPW